MSLPEPFAVTMLLADALDALGLRYLIGGSCLAGGVERDDTTTHGGHGPASSA